MNSNKPDPLNELRDLIDASHWTFAKTMPQWPHWYTILRESPDKILFKNFAEAIFRTGVDEPWGNGRITRYLYIDNFKYWSMDPTAEKTDLINRAEVKKNEP